MRFSREVEWNIWESFHTLLKGIFPAKITKECNRICVIKNDAPCWSGVMNRYSALWKQLKKCPWNIFEMSARASKKCHARRHPIVFSCQSYFIKGISCAEFDSAKYKRTWRDRRLINYFCHSEAFSLLPIKLCLFFCKISKLFFWQLPRQPDEINTAADRLRQSARFPASLLVCLTSPSLSLSPPNITMHLASPAATVWCSHPPPVGLYPTFISVSVFPSIHLCDSSEGRRGFESLSVLPCEGESYGGFERESALLWVLYDISFPVRVTKEVHSPRSSLKTPALSYKVPSCIARTEQDGDPSGELVIKHLPLLNMSTHFHPNPLPPSRLTFSPHRRFVADWKEMKRRDMKRSFSSWSWTQSLSSLFFFFSFAFFFPHLPSYSPRLLHTFSPDIRTHFHPFCMSVSWLYGNYWQHKIFEPN